MGKTTIEWADKVWNPVTGCTPVSAGCAHCYAERIAKRFWGERSFNQVMCHEDRLDDPLHWKKPARVFVNSMSDLFHPDVPFGFIMAVWGAMESGPQHTYMILTKRPDRMIKFWNWWTNDAGMMGKPIVLPNVWMGVSVENQAMADERIPLLLNTPAAVRFVSVEPMLGPVNIFPWLIESPEDCSEFCDPSAIINWVICGGESGPGARPMHPDWARSLRDQCQEVKAPFFFKHWGEWAPDCLCDSKVPHKNIDRPQPGLRGCMFHCGKANAGRKLDGRTWDEFPEVKG